MIKLGAGRADSTAIPRNAPPFYLRNKVGGSASPLAVAATTSTCGDRPQRWATPAPKLPSRIVGIDSASNRLSPPPPHGAGASLLSKTKFDPTSALAFDGLPAQIAVVE